MNQRVYICYSRKDKEKVFNIKNELIAITSATFLMYDYNVEGIPEQYVLDAVHGINECDIFLFMLSGYSQLSEKPMMELAYAYKKQSLNKRIYILNIDGSDVKDSFLFRWGKYRIYDWNDANSKAQLTILLKPTTEINNSIIPKLHHIYKNGKYGFVNHKGEIVIPCKWTKVEPFSEGLAVVDDSSGKYGFLDMNGNRIIPCTWDRAESFEDGMAIVKLKNGPYEYRCGVIDKLGNILIPITYSSLEYIGDGMFKYYHSSKYGIINRDNKNVKSTYWFSVGRFSEGLCPVQDMSEGHKYGFIDRSGHLVIRYWWENASDFSEGLAVVMDKDRKYGVIDIQGKVVIPCYHDYLSGFYEGLCAFKGDEGFGFINKEDEIIINAEWTMGYYYSGGFHCGRCLVKDSDGKYGYINKDGSLVIPYTWDNAEVFDDGTAWVKADDTWKLIDIDGNYI